ncbi:MAG: right-handed parallel beta-helix repeat-containing protein [Planctomycetota bacterium]
MSKVLLRSVVALVAALMAAPSAAQCGPTPSAFIAWVILFQSGDPRADVNEDGLVNSSDFFYFILLSNEDCEDGGDDSAGDSGGNSGGTSGGSAGSGPGGTVDSSADQESGGNGGDQSVDGWTEFTPSSDTRRIYVSSRSGNDRNNGRSPSQAVRTIERGKSLLRDGRPDWLLLRTGDVWYEAIGGWNLSGRSSREPMLVSSYGSGARPKLITGSGKALSMVTDRHDRHHVAFVGLHFEPSDLGSDIGVRVVASTVKDLLIEDCYIGGYRQNIVLDSESRERKSQDIRIRRNVIVDGLGSAFSFGIYAESVDGLLIEGNFIDRNGWDYRRGRNATATMFGHNIYLQRSVEDAVVRDNIITRAAAHGMQIRHGGIVENNIFAENPISLLFSNQELDRPRATDRVVSNVIVGGIDINNSNRRGWGLHVTGVKQVRVADNIIANIKLGADRGYGLLLTGDGSSDRVFRTTIENNIIDDYGQTFRIFNDIAQDVTFRRNVLSKTAGSESVIYIRENRPLPGVRFSGNSYLHTTSNRPFAASGASFTLSEWRNRYEPTAAPLRDEYRNGDRTMDSYARAIGMWNASNLYQRMREQSRRNWDEDLTAESLRQYFRWGYSFR